MAITVQAIESKEFKIKRLNGYDPEDVDIFLDEICDFIIALQEEKARLQAQLNMQAMAAPVVPAPYPYAQSAAPVPPPFTPEKKEEEKVQEIARIIGGIDLTEKQFDAAKTLINQSKELLSEL